MPAPFVASAGRAALQVLARAAAGYARQRAVTGVWRWKRALAVGLGTATFFSVSLCSGIGSALQTSTLPWPVLVPEAGREATGWLAGGWHITSTFGWRRDPLNPERMEFHDGVDLAGPPFCLHCRVPSLFDARVRYLGWDPYRDRSGAADTSGGGMLVMLQTPGDEQAGVQNGELVATYAHLAPYRLLVQLQGRIDDPWQRDEYLQYADYRELGDELLPAPDEAALAIACSSERSERVPEFVAHRIGAATFEFLYDKPIVAPVACSISMTWPQRGEEWIGWVPDDPGAGALPDTAEIEFGTPIEQGVRAGDIAIRFRAHLTAPPPPPTPLPYPAPAYPAPAAGPTSGGERAGSATTAGVRKPGCEQSATGVACGWPLASIEPPQQPAYHGAIEGEAQLVERRLPEPAAASTSSAQGPADGQCGRIELVRVPARANDPRMTPDAAAAWQRADELITAALGYAWLRNERSDIMRPVTHVPSRHNQILASWHKTGRAVDVPQTGRALRLVQEGGYQRLFVDGIDITALMVRAGFTRIPSNPSRQEWWHFELQGGLSWQGAMAQLYPISLLKQLYPLLDWSDFRCEGQAPAYPAPGVGWPFEHEEPYPTCSEGVPSWTKRLEELAGCGPPLTWTSEIQTLDHVIGHIGHTGATTGTHLHIGLRQRSGASAGGNYPVISVCEPPWLPDELQGKSPAEIRHTVFVTWKADCYSGSVDPLDFLPRANSGPPLPLATAAPLDGAPAQLPPPGTDGALLRPVPSGAPSTGEYWSPFGRWGRFGGGGVLEWLRSMLCSWLGEWGFFCSD